MALPWTKWYYKHLVKRAIAHANGSAHAKIKAHFRQSLGLEFATGTPAQKQKRIHYILKGVRNLGARYKDQLIGCYPIGFEDLKIECFAGESNTCSVYLFGQSDGLNFFDTYARYCKKGSLVVDVGANVGMHSVVMAACVGSEGIVYAFEPSAYLVERLKRNIQLNGIDNIQLHPFALADKKGEIGFVDLSAQPNIGKSHIDEASTIKVKMDTLDHCVKDRRHLSFIKIDVEGAELDVLHGAQRVLSEHRPAVLMEANLWKYSLRDVELALPYPCKIYLFPDLRHQPMQEIPPDQFDCFATQTIDIFIEAV